MSCNEANNWFAHVILSPASRFNFHLSANLANDDYTFCFWISFKQFQAVFHGSADNGVTANTDSRGLTQACIYTLINSFISECSGFGDYTNIPFFADESGHDTQLAFVHSNNSRTVGANHPGTILIDNPFHFDHIMDRNAFRNTNHYFDTGETGFHDRFRSERRRNKNNRSIGTGDFHRILNRIENRHTVIQCFLTAFTRCNTGNDICPILQHLPRMELTFGTRDSLDDDF